MKGLEAMSESIGGASHEGGRRWSEEERRQFAADLRGDGFAEEEIAAWLSVPPYVGVAEQAAKAREWRAQGFHAADAVRWEEVAFDPTDATMWAAEAFAPRQAEYVRNQILCRSTTGDVQQMLKEESAWRASGIPPLWVCRVLGAGARSIAEGRSQHAQSRTDPHMLGRLRLQAGLAGWDFSYLEAV